jgi:sugar lactone lactonase YvrE
MNTTSPDLPLYAADTVCLALRRRGRALLFGALALLPVGGLYAQSSFQATEIGQTSALQMVTVAASAAGQVGKVEVLTLGTTGLDYSDVAGGSCSAGNTYGLGDTCTVMVTFSPEYPGQRPGAVVMLNAAGVPMGTTLLSGSGNGALGVFTPGTALTVAGDGEWVNVYDGSPATSADLDLPFAMALDGAGNLYIADSAHNRIRKVDAKTQIISTYGGNGTQGYTGDNGLATSATINVPHGLAIDGAGNLYFADSGNNVVRRIDAATGIMTTVAGTGAQGYAGDGAPATAAELNTPSEVAFDTTGNLYIADTLNQCVREVNASSGTIATVAGNGSKGFAGDGGPATSAELNVPYALAFDSQGHLFIADSGNNRIREVNGGAITTVVGNGIEGFAGDGGPAAAAEMYSPSGLAFDPADNLFIADTQNNRVRKVVQGTINTVFGNGSGKYSGDGAAANQAGDFGPYSVFVGPTGELYIADYFDHRIRGVDSRTVLLTYPTALRQGQTSPPQSQGMENDGDEDLVLSGITPDANAAVDPATTSCTTTGTLSVDADCQVGAEFAPSEPGNPLLGHINLTGAMGNSPLVITLEGQALALNSTTVSLLSSRNPADAGQSVTFIATVASGTGTPTGIVTFMDGTQILGTATLSGSSASTSASFGTTALQPGAHSITAVYAGDADHSGSTSAVLTETILGQTATTLTTSSNPAAVNTPLVLTASVTSTSPGGLAPTGTIVFYDGTVVIGTQPVNAAGIATMTTSTLTVGQHPLIAVYNGDSYNEASTSATVQESIVQRATTTALVSSVNPSIFGNSVTYTATVAVTGGGTATGTVTLFDGGTQIGAAPLNGDTAVFAVASLQAGTGQSLTAHYSGDSTDASSVSPVLAETVQQAETATALSYVPQPAIAGANTTLTATVTDTTGAGIAGGTVTFTEAGAVLGQAALNANGVATLTAKFGPGSPTVVASYSGDTNHSASNTSSQLSVQQATTQVVVTSSSNPSIFGTAVIFTIHVQGNGGTPGGAVTLLADGQNVGSATLNADVATVSTSALTVGVHALTATYAGDTNDNGSSTSAPLTQTVNKATPIETVAASPGSAIAGTVITLNAQVKATGATPEPTGNVTFSSGGATLGTVAVSATGLATLSTTALTAGENTITAAYSGDGSYAAVTATTTEDTLRSTTATVTPSVNPAIAGASVTFTIQLTGATATPQGRVTLLDGANLLTTIPLNASGTAMYTTSSLTPGVHNITAHYTGDASNGATTSDVLMEQVQAATTHTALTASASSVTAGKTVSLTATITGNGGEPTGTVQFLDGGKILGQGTLSDGVATFFTSTLTPGTHSLTAQYVGDTDDGSSVSGLVSVIVNSASTQVAVTSSINPATVTKPVIFNIQVTGNGSTPGGTVTLTSNGVTLGSNVLNSSGSATFTVSTLALGSDTIVASYAGDTDDGAAQGAIVETVVQARPLLSLTSIVSPSQVGASVTFTSSLSQNVGTPDGTVSFTADGAALGSASVATDGIAALTNSSLLRGQHSIVATYNGDTDNATAQAAAFTQTVQQATATTLAASANPAFGGLPVTFTVTVAGPESSTGGAGPGGTVTLYDGAAELGTQTLANGSASFSISTLSVGSHALTAHYAGDTLDVASTSTALNEQVQSGHATVTLTTSGSPVLLGTTVTFTATVTGTGASPAGPVTFSSDGKTIGSSALNAQGQASLTTASLGAGSHAIVASYGGSADEAAASSAPVTELVQVKTNIVLTSSVNPVLASTPIQFTAQVTSVGGIAPTGTVTLLDGTRAVGTVQVGVNGSATFTLSTLAAGTHTLTASYSGDGVSLPSVSSALTELINAIATKLNLGASATALTTDQQLTLLASIDSSANAPFSGTITFTANGKVIGTAPAAGTGNATLSPSLAPGTYTVTASYGGDAYNAPATSPSLTIVVSQAQDFTANANDTTLTMATKTNATLTITLQSAGGFSDQINMGCANLPYDMTCTFSKPSVMLAAGSTQTATVTIDTSSPLSSGGVAANKSTPTGIYFAGVFPGALWWLLAGRGKRRRRTALLAAVAAVGLLPMMLFSGCNGLNMTSASPGQYVVQITTTGLNSHITHTIDVSVDVTK